ncbi:potassium channel family protein [Nocardioides bizhenqiangii]|uniref:Potassium channel family protein n=1 Tax=Nocardioides bizhenqiangii TaxID=3095076 RepID=A0ABZ0ZVB1_9ACTN|nr:potassium channel family protein [Nocardioides sp. HM61]WQQ28267.1 potassium channel family protein [Nocardioides sp. HM61]
MTSVRAELSPARRRRLIGRGLLKAAASTLVLVVLYFVSPLERVDGVPVGVSLVVGLLLLLGVCTWQIRAIPRAAHPGVRAIEALAITAPLFLLLFAAAYFVMAQDDPESFNVQGLTRSDALYFTVTVFATVGFGDISATSQIARRLVTVQILLDLLVLGLGIRVFAGAVQRGRERQ